MGGMVDARKADGTGGADGTDAMEERMRSQHPDLPLAQVRRAEERSRSAGPWSLAHLRVCWLVLLAAGAVLTVVAAAVAGGRAAASAGIGIGIVGAFFTVSAVLIAAVGARVPKAVLATALATYLVKMVALGAVVVLLPRDGYVQPRWMAGAVAVGLIAWVGAHLRYVWTAKIFYTDPS